MLPKKQENIFFSLILCVLEGITNILLSLPRDPSSHTATPERATSDAFISERNAGFLLSVHLLQGNVRQCLSRYEIQGDCRGQALSLAGSCAYGACGLPGPSIIALGRPLDLNLRGIQRISVELLVVWDELPWHPERKEAMQSPRAAAVTGSPLNRKLLNSLCETSPPPPSRVSQAPRAVTLVPPGSPALALRAKQWLFKIFTSKTMPTVCLPAGGCRGRLSREQDAEGSFVFITSFFF